MSLVQELAKENFLEMALHGTRGVLQKELEINQIIFSMTGSPKKDIVRRAAAAGASVSMPYSYMLINSLAGVRDKQNNFAVRRHGMRFNHIGEKATSKKGYIFPMTIGLELHYVDSDQKRLLSLAQSLAVLSLTNGLNFHIGVGTLFSFDVRLELPLDVPITLQEGENPETPGATDITAQIVMHTQVGFTRDVSAVNGEHPILNVSVQMDDGREDSFQLEQ